MKGKTKFFAVTALALFAIVIFGGLGSAAQCLELTNFVVPADVQSDAGNFNVSFDLVHEGGACTANRTDVTWSFTSNINGMTWTEPPITDINVDQIIPVTTTFTLPPSQSGNIDIEIIVDSAQDDAETFFLPLIPIITDNSAITLTKVKELTKNQSGIVKVTNTGNVNLNIDMTQAGDFDVIFSESSFVLNAGTSKDITVSSIDLDDLSFGNNVATITAADSTQNVSKSIDLTVSQSFCEVGSVGGNLEISDVDFNNEGEGGDDTWQLLDVIEVEVRVDNDGNDDIKDIFVELGLFDNTGRNQISDLDFENADEEKIDLGRLNDGDDDRVTFRFRVPADIEDGSYMFAVKAYSDDLGEDVECIDTSSSLSDDIFETIDVERESDEGKFISFEDTMLNPEEATCGESVVLTTNVFNVGDEDQDQVKVNLFNTELGLNKMVEIRNDLDQGENERTSFEFVIPQGLEDKIYQLRMNSEYDYRSGSYRQSSEEETLVPLRILGCSVDEEPSGENSASINAVLDSDAVAGDELVVRATITSLKSGTNTFLIDANDYESWSSLSDVSERILELDQGESKEVTFKFNLNADAEGSESFNIEVVSGSDVEIREVVVNIAPGSSGGITGFAGFGEGNTTLWIIGIVNVVLIILIIIVAVKVSRR
ncbi:putative S-layer protein [Candidatus Pacearchaeota archaeon]|nr:putative S-layer protein [Candidatus Pacearchaeota archaeon]